ncbi:MAG: AAA family ATPase, partial [Bryobacteraceae bacterium]|nr:AAA family ATPase [Bryobacteraceae bacterium]
MSAQFAVRRGEIADLVKRIRSAIRDELNASSRGLPFRVCDIAPKGALLYMTLTPEDKNSILDETLEEGNMRWQGETTGGAEIVSVVPSLSVINACLTEGQPPLKGSLIYVNPPRYLEALLSVWEDDLRAAEIAQWIFNLDKNRIIWDKEVPCSVFKGLRPAQERSFSLVKWKTSFLWGPPGTGKTYTLGRLLASYLLHYPNDRVLLLSSTNVAVDLAILAVDNAVNELQRATRPVCYRFGSRFNPQRFEKREHLIPLRNKQLVHRLHCHYERVPDPAQADLYLKWRQERDKLREAIRRENLEFLNRAQLAAMTATLAAHDYASLGKFDLVVFDEASQIGKAQAATFANLGPRSLFAGDPKQLAPVAQATSPDADNWLGRSPFEWDKRSSMQHAQCMLDEQWRMAEPICSAVSYLFYDSRLRVAEPACADGEWLRVRQPRRTQLLESDSNVVLIDTCAAPKLADRFRGYECEESATLIAALVADHVSSWSIDIRKELIVLTPYRAQRRTIETMLRSINVPSVVAST